MPPQVRPGAPVPGPIHPAAGKTAQPMDPIATTIAVEVEGEPRALTAQTTFWVPGE